jgi:putative membrane protein
MPTAGESPQGEPVRPHPSAGLENSYLANERTFLAWVRTAFSLLGFGVTIAKLGWDLAMLRDSPTHGDHALVLGAILIGLAFGTILLGLFRYNRTVRDISQGDFKERSGFALILGIAGAGTCVVLLAYLWVAARSV